MVTVAVVLAVACTRSAPDSAPRYDFAAQRGFRRVSVVMILFDELPVATLMNRRGAIDANLFPNFAKLQQDSTWFRNMISTSPFSNEAVPTLLTGKSYERELPLEDQVHPRSLFTLLGGAYEISAQAGLPALCPFSKCDAGEANRDSRLVQEFRPFSSGARGLRFASFVDLIEMTTLPRFHFLHLIMPHYPWRYLPSGQRYAEKVLVPGEVDLPGRGRGWESDKWLVTQAYQRHMLQSQLADRLLGAIIRKLKKEGLYERSLVTVLADHGISFRAAQPKRWMREETVGGIAAIPWFLKEPFQHRAVTSDVPAQTVDVVPTLAEVLELSTLWPGLEGKSALDNSISFRRTRVAKTVSLDPRGSEKYGVVREKYSMLDLGRRPQDLFRIGPGRSEKLVGRAVRHLMVAPRGTATARVPRLAAYENTSPTANVFPALVEGSVENVKAARPVRVAVAVNGTIAAVTRTFTKRGNAEFYAMVSPERFHEPPNRLLFFRVVDVESGTLVSLNR